MKRLFYVVLTLAATVAIFTFIPNLFLQLQDTYAQSAYPPPLAPSSVTSIPYPPPDTKPIEPTSATTEKPVFVTITIDVTVNGLENQDVAELKLVAGTEKTATILSRTGTLLPTSLVTNKTTKISAYIPVGVYLLIVDSPPSYLREPQGYLFLVSETGMARTSRMPFHFELIPPSAQTLPPCRQSNVQNDLTVSTSVPSDISFSVQEVCIAEGIIDLSDPRNQLRLNESNTSSPLTERYHYAGPITYQDNKGVWGRNNVVDPNVVHDGSPSQFVAERVYVDNGTSWIEAGWSEDSWKDERQYVYVMDSVGYTSIYFPEYMLTTGSPVETKVYYNSSVNKWRALYYLGNSQWAVLREVSLGFITADHGYNMGEVYTDNGIHPILPPSGFDKGYLLIDGVWKYWNSRYATDVWEWPPDESPYECDMLTQYYRFIIHSPVIYLPLVLNEQN